MFDTYTISKGLPRLAQQLNQHLPSPAQQYYQDIPCCHSNQTTIKTKKSTSHVSNKENKTGMSHRLLLNMSYYQPNYFISLNFFEVLLSVIIKLSLFLLLARSTLCLMLANLLGSISLTASLSSTNIFETWSTRPASSSSAFEVIF